MHGNTTAYKPTCLTRDFAPQFAQLKLNSSFVDSILDNSNSFSAFDYSVQAGLEVESWTYHAGGHNAVGSELGVMADFYASPGDALFYLHHANMDRLWWIWQRREWSTRGGDISGPVEQFGAPFDFKVRKISASVTLDFQMEARPLASRGMRIGDVMDISRGALCYVYDGVD
jgi:tyrosinase